jgi:hypothetical protein
MTIETKEPVPWSVTVLKLEGDHYRTVFAVGVQSFILADVEDDDEAEDHCKFIANMFMKAMKSAGCPDPSNTTPFEYSRS